MKGEARSELICGVLRALSRSVAAPAVWFGRGDAAGAARRWLDELRAAAAGAGPWPRLRRLLGAARRLHARALAELAAVEQRAPSEPQRRRLLADAAERTCDALRAWRSALGAYLDELKDCVPAPDVADLKRELDFNQVISDAVCDVRQKAVDFGRNTPALDHVSRVRLEMDATREWCRTLFRNTCVQFCKALFLEVVDGLNERTQATARAAAGRAALDRRVRNDVLCCHSLCRLLFANTDCLNKPRIVMQIHTLRENITSLEKDIESLEEGDRARSHELRRALLDVKALRESLRTLELLCPKKVKINPQYECEPNEDSLYDQIVTIWQAFESGTVDSAQAALVTERSTYRDQLGEYYIDKYGRKIYETELDIYQLDQDRRLVPLQDDERVYYYDQHGRYYLDRDKARVYRRDGDTGEYKLQVSGRMIGAREDAEKKEAFFDHIGRYYFQSDESPRGGEAGSEGASLDPLDTAECPPAAGAVLLRESRYLQRSVGAALAACLARTVLAQPQHPVTWLADELERYQQAAGLRRRREEDEAERRRRREEMRAQAPPSRDDSGGSEAYSLDTNLMNYETLTLDD